MSDKLSIYNTGNEAMDALAPFYREEAVGKIREFEARESWFILMNAAAVDPAPLTTKRINAVTPYSSPVRTTEAIESALENEFLIGDGKAGYRLTEKGRSVVSSFFDTAQALIAQAPVLSEEEMGRLAAYLQRLVTATKALPTPSEKPNLENSLWTDPGPDAALIVLVDQYLTDLRAFRDDAHIAAWKNYDVDGPTWETLTFLWRDEAHNATELGEKLESRRFSEEDYAASLAVLAGKGWVAPSGDNWQITEAGSAARQEGEDETDRIFFAGWDALMETELDGLYDLLQCILLQLREAAPAPEPA